ncbi:electron transfer flavoprotein subunit beta/FixA family protein [Engelhardtia mirabilis]|uniref:Electron transfer flavoprotein subunit beta n=1 Tax=Engelhardtia mirabilis TaxID=2528011 RepID=A0A518BFF8_9BACT|nr:Electron transfer flavoprotein subunit beta [Planctomycetes bacterium Pla133]QDV00046.1 Electron transfer flavoprotein subunit beta [Planctomycetes bacterium Pla86]
MKIVACVKRVPTTEVQPTIAADGKSVDANGLQYMLSFYDEIAVEQAVQVKEKLGGGEVTVLTVGPKDSSKELRECLAKGADKGVILIDENWTSRDCLSTAKALAAQVTAEGAELVLAGRVATDRDNAAVGPMLATLLGWACVTDVIELSIEAGKGVAKRESDAGVEEYEFALPAVITCQKGLAEPRYAGLKGIMAAKKKPLEEIAIDPAANQASVVSLAEPPARPAGRIIGEGTDAVAALIDALRNEAKVI